MEYVVRYDPPHMVQQLPPVILQELVSILTMYVPYNPGFLPTTPLCARGVSNVRAVTPNPMPKLSILRPRFGFPNSKPMYKMGQLYHYGLIYDRERY